MNAKNLFPLLLPDKNRKDRSLTKSLNIFFASFLPSCSAFSCTFMHFDAQTATYAPPRGSGLNCCFYLGFWRRRRDSNPRDPSGPTPLAGERLRPLGHVSADGSTILSNSKTSGKYKKPSLFTICSFLHPQLTRSACTFPVNFFRNSIQTTRPDIGNKSNV